MNLLLMVAALSLGADQPASDAGTASPHLKGKWLIVYAEEGGRRNNSWEQRQATVDGNTLKYEADGKEHSLTLKFGPHQTVTASESGGNGGGEGQGHKGVYINGKDYFCISLQSGSRGGGRTGGGADDGKTANAGGADGEKSSGSFILILRRQRGGAESGESK